MALFWSIPDPSPSPLLTPVDEGTRDLLGYDILYTNNNLQVSPAGDYVRVGGLDNLRAAIYRRLITRPGEFKFRPEYGVGVQSYVKRSASKANLDALRQRIVDQLSQDRRIQKVEVAIDTKTLNGEFVVQVYVRCTTGGTERKFEPFSFKESAS